MLSRERCCVFFFKQKTAYEMRISDWSSDVCSPYLVSGRCLCGDVRIPAIGQPYRVGICHCLDCRKHHDALFFAAAIFPTEAVTIDGATHEYRGQHRSEEHTSELQSLMRISYAVFCLKKKQNIRHRVEQIQNAHNT